MTNAVIGALRGVLGLDSAQFEKGLTAAQKRMRDTGRQFEAVGARMSSVGAGLSVAVTAPLIAAGFAASKAATQAADAMGQVNAALKSMGAASGKTSEELAGLAEGLMRNSLYDDDDILRKVTANLLTFGKVAGAEFDRAQQAAVDLATRMQMDLQPATLLVGKALNDPIKGLTAMGRAGIQFTTVQKAQIKAMTEAGNVAGAQRIILGELERQFGGAAAAAQNTDPYDRMRDSLNSLSEKVGAILNTYLTPLLDRLAGLADRFNDLSPQMQTMGVAAAALAAALGPVLIVVGSIVSAIGALIATPLLPFIAAAAAAAAAVALAFAVWGDRLTPIVKDFGQAVVKALGPTIPPLVAAVRGALEAMAPVVEKAAKAFMWFAGPVIVTGLRALAATVTTAFEIIGQAFRVIGKLLQGDWAGAWNAFGSMVKAVVVGIGRVFEALFPGVIGSVKRLYEGVRDWLYRKLGEVLGWVINRVKSVGDAFYRLYDAVVGHSYVPDMVIEVGQWMSKLDEVMVKPVNKATREAAEAFEALRERAKAAMSGLMTDRERASVELQSQLREWDELLAKKAVTPDQHALFTGRARAEFARTNAGIDADGLSMPAFGGVDAATPELDRVGEVFGQIRDRIAASREAFADAFSYALESAARGDWRGVLNSVINDVFGSALRSAGRSVFNALQRSFGDGGGGWDLGKIGSSIGSLFSRLPKFANEGTIREGGGGAIDSQLVAFWKSPGERVDVYKPDRDGGAVGSIVRVVPSKYFDVAVEQAAGPVAARTAAAGAAFAMRAVPAEMGRRGRQQFGGSFG